jgi:hypothetical protein
VHKKYEFYTTENHTAMWRSLLPLLLLAPIYAGAQRKWMFTNELAYVLNGAGDLGGYKIDAGVEREIFHKTYVALRLGVSETKGDETTLIYYHAYQNDAAISFTGAINRDIKLAKWLSIVPELGFVLRSHKWTIVTGPGYYISKGDHLVPPGSADKWKDNALGYHVQLPIVFRTGRRTMLSLFAAYENDTFGYTFFSVGTGLKIGLGND